MCAWLWTKKSQRECVACDATVDPWEILKLVITIFALCFLVGGIMICLSFAIGDVYEEPDESAASFENPLVEEDGPADSAGDVRANRSSLAKVSRKISGMTIIRTSHRLLSSGVSMSAQPVKLFLSYWQIAAQLGAVLHFQFPSMLSGLFKFFRPFTANIHGLVALECAGLKDFYSSWIFEVFVVPSVLWACVGAYYLYRRNTVGVALANALALSEGFFVLFLVYPVITYKTFGVLNCRRLSATEDFLVSDYGIDCNTGTHLMLEIVSTFMIFFFSIGVPVFMAVRMTQTKRQRQRQFETPTWQYISRRVMSQLSQDNLQEVQHTLIDIALGTPKKSSRA